MHISTLNGVFNLPPDFSLEATVNNPMLDENGSASIPLTLPPTNHNLELAGYPQNMDRQTVQPPDIDVTVHAGEVNKRGRMSLFGAGPSGFDVTVYFDDGDFYAAIKNKKLNEVVTTVRDEWGGDVTTLLNYLMAVMREEVTDDFMLFPIVAEYNAPTDGATAPATILNDTKEKSGEPTEVFTCYEPVDKIIDGITITLPAGYGVTPFLRLHTVISLVFTYFGYTLLNNPFSETDELRRLVLLNNTADTVVRGTIDYSQLLPTDTVADLLNTLMAVFGQVCYLNSSARTARFVALNQTFAAPADVELTTKLINRITLTYNPPRRLSAQAGTSVGGAAPAYDTYTDMLTAYQPVYGNFVPRNEFNFTDVGDGSDYPVIRAATGDYYLLHTGVVDGDRRYTKKVSSPYFPFTATDTDVAGTPLNNSEKYEVSAKNEWVPVDLPAITGKPERLYPMYTVGVQHFNSRVRLQDGSIQQEAKVTDRHMAFCFARGLARDGLGVPLRYFYGTTQKYDNAGNPQAGSTLSLQYNGNGGLQQFIESYAAFLKIGVAAECEVKLENYEVFSLNLSAKKYVHNQNFIIQSVNYKMEGNRAKVKMWLFR